MKALMKKVKNIWNQEVLHGFRNKETTKYEHEK